MSHYLGSAEDWEKMAKDRKAMKKHPYNLPFKAFRSKRSHSNFPLNQGYKNEEKE